MDGHAWASGDVVVDGVSLHYHRTGGDKPVLVLLHGITDAGPCWTRVARELQDEFDIVMPDARGHGRSARLAGDLTVPRLAADVAGLLDALGIANALLVGHSMGAITAAAVAAERPDLVRGVVLEDPPLESRAAPPPSIVAAFRADMALWPTLPVDERHAKGAAQNPAWDRVETDAWADAKALVDGAVLASFLQITAFDWADAFARMRCPGLLVIADRDLRAIVSPEAAARAVSLWPAGRVVRVEGAGHNVHRDQWARAMAAIGGFLREQVALRV